MAKLCVQYEGNWTDKLSEYDVSGEFLASTFRNRRYSGIFTLETSQVDEALAVIEDHPTVERMRIIEDYADPRQGRTLVTLYLKEQLTEFTPRQTLLYEGYLPLGSTSLQDGVECFDLLVMDREELSNAVQTLREFGPVNVERISQEFQRHVTPLLAEWHELLSSIP